MNNYFAYTRVSTTRQGETGVSLSEQRSAIEHYAKTHHFSISNWYEERLSAAKTGRPIFSQMLKELKRSHTTGVIIHKIDRGVRNLKDWALLGELIDQGIEVRFANDDLDLSSRGGRLAADIQAVVAADFIRNLRDEVKKGFYGRVKQGLYPLPAPIGYLNQGAGKPKMIDPVTSPLVRLAFEYYASGAFNLRDLSIELYRLGLRSRRGRRITRSGLSGMLTNPFYMGVIHIRKDSTSVPGIHTPFIPPDLFDRVQDTFNKKRRRKRTRHSFLFQRVLHCQACRFTLSGERQKGFTYYRCHTLTCPMKTVREEVVEEAFVATLADQIRLQKVRPPGVIQ